MILPNLLLIAGTGNKSGKTTFACKVIGQHAGQGIAGIKITPHFHETTPGLVLLAETKGSSVYEETDPETGKDTSRMLKAGAARVFFVKVTDNNLLSGFKKTLEYIPAGAPIVCESPALRHYVEPGLLVIMSSEHAHNNKDISKLLQLPHVSFKLDEVSAMKAVPLNFQEGKWVFTGNR
ncbi:MAG: hypothetical protein MUE74_09175 [Bacteroidales bacterium]|jgi:hypothetical protein|nr:hypothetical protein [Bacteroidales bacterium]